MNADKNVEGILEAQRMKKSHKPIRPMETFKDIVME